jgi:hypothetical protein
MAEPRFVPLSVARLATDKRLPEAFLRQLGIADVNGGGISIPYRDMEGNELLVRRRGVPGRPRFEQPRGVKLAPYGRWRLRDAAEEGYLILVEGESDCWALWHHGKPALGLPGSTSSSCLEKEDLPDTVKQLYVHLEPDQGGPAFAAGIARRLKEIGWEGDAYVFHLGDDKCKDPADLHVKAANFDKSLSSAINASEPLSAPAPELPSTNGRVPAEVAEPPIPDPVPWPEPPGKEAFHGLAGDFVRLIDPETESDPVALLVQFLCAFGNVVGRHTWQTVGQKRHYCNLFVALVGPTGHGRKGTALDWVRGCYLQADPTWDGKCVLGGLSSGEGLINAVRDGDDASRDKRLLAIEEEFASVLRAGGRDGSILTHILRKAWDGGMLATMTRHNPVQATGAHVSLIGHVTKQELTSTLTSVDTANGVANRFLWIAVRRSKLLPEGGDSVDLCDIVHELKLSIRAAAFRNRLIRSKECRELWAEVYPRLSGDRRGVLGLVTNRAEAHVLRLMSIYALLDRADGICVQHLKAALALWDYCERSCNWVFGIDRQADPDADLLLAAIRAAEARGGLTQSEVSDVFGRHKSASQLRQLISRLLEGGFIVGEKTATSGRPIQRWKIRSETAKKGVKAKEAAPQGKASNGDLTLSPAAQLLSLSPLISPDPDHISTPFDDMPAPDSEPLAGPPEGSP